MKLPTKDRVAKEARILLSASALGLFFALMIVAYSQAYAETVQNEIASNVIRFHVLANSDNYNDQALKNTVRDGILDKFGDKICPSDSIEESREFLLANLGEIEAYAAKLLQKNGYNYSVKAVIDRIFFPTRTYNTMSFPAGEYEALRIIIGEGRGSNWWCVMFPPLCYVESPEQSHILSNLLSEDAYALVSHTQGGTGVTVRFRVVEWWQERMHQNQDSADDFRMYLLNLNPQ